MISHSLYFLGFCRKGSVSKWLSKIYLAVSCTKMVCFKKSKGHINMVDTLQAGRYYLYSFSQLHHMIPSADIFLRSIYNWNTAPLTHVRRMWLLVWGRTAVSCESTSLPIQMIIIVSIMTVKHSCSRRRLWCEMRLFFFHLVLCHLAES